MSGDNEHVINRNAHSKIVRVLLPGAQGVPPSSERWARDHWRHLGPSIISRRFLEGTDPQGSTFHAAKEFPDQTDKNFLFCFSLLL